MLGLCLIDLYCRVTLVASFKPFDILFSVLFCAFNPRDVVSAVYATATWLAGCHTPVLYQNG